MRLDKYLSQATGLPRSLIKRQIKCKNVEVNGQLCQDHGYKVRSDDQVSLEGRDIAPPGPKYLMLNKPAGTVCVTEDSEHPTVIDLLEQITIRDLHPAGRLDIDTTGLVLITNDGQWSHRVTSPKHQCDKVYLVSTAEPITADYIQQFAAGITLRNEDKPTLPAELEILSDTQARVTLHEGRYHQVKRMFAAMGNKVTALHREQIGNIRLDDDLEAGEYRFLTAAEANSF
ncbi:16S rRNA pseudouridine(516) synthase RsuA [Amphritea sp. 1_MG-2023]|uniref:16S rRNA pseudouridine(516) synthase RsuA n=1 Tax=Amphritea sp. 1_MG-2023 TaxID=3062670 RepID=UPI0026E409A3|nr:16S rRNA pseudouridine(516) synthase RsuA [Amphritea sp. 1_MG-2023]MDO6563919.1 16S rRNA pseudouridine(516) synthase RsuA [Amphritea sp. 1_MG-2023]